ncbi:MAG: 50S ribosomal protein L6 [Candidatus Magasanikbacteria bacterium CG_4_9_14_3_um_filter_32_9]|uniref:Large ribosomal subunit protein uL6 n=1 Tax=Candidatus Magasanikbacteria bacterium CG_4_9_14_3_um_filter_32_9 TaxID=1974644 RepID=A0A2M7Z7J2_9BACT|nr:MAG: 50S ribosomal protein L6 [Candidatus Magasanikbacteria bacterium CG_4_9_14_3_um_filter_32_9]
MSRIGKQIIQIPQGVTVETVEGFIIVKGPKGELKKALNPIVKVNITENEVTVKVDNENDKKERSLWGTFASHIKNMVVGVTEGYKKQLEINGVGYRVAMQGKDLKMEVGFSHSVIFDVPEGITLTVEKNLITIEGIDKELVGQTAAEIRAIKKPEPYKGKGIKYVDEVIRRKAGKAAKSA